MTAHLDEHLDLCAAYALGCLDAPDRVRLVAHLATGCTECRAALRGFDAATAARAGTAPPVAPPPELRARVLAAARADVGPVSAPVLPLETRRSTGPWWLWAAAAACLVFAVWNLRAVRQLHGVVAQQTERVMALERDRASLEARLDETRRWVSTATAGGAQIANLAPTADGNPNLRGRAIVDPKTQRAALALNNLQAVQGRDYQLWSIHDGKPHSLGVLHPDAEGNVFLNVDVGDGASLQALAVSLELLGGSPSVEGPSGPIVLLARMGG